MNSHVTTLPDGVELTGMTVHRDERGWLAEVFRDEWRADGRPCQWNVTMSERNVLRGVHVHHRHWDYLVVLRGKVSVGLHDVRPRSPTYRQSTMFELSGERLTAMRLPTGIMHGFYCHEQTLYVYGVDAYFDSDDELGCHWADPQLGFAWPCRDPLVSERDRRAGSLAEVESKLRSLSQEFA